VAALDVHAVLQAGGRGERLREVSGDVPKALLRVGGVPMVERLLRQLVAAGIRRITVITGWKADPLEAHLRALAGLPADLELRFLRETAARGNVGSLARLPRDRDPVLLCFADLVTDLDFAKLARRHREGCAAVTLASHWESHRLTLGELATDGERVVGYEEKPEKRFRICSGIAIFEPAVLDLIEAERAFGLVDLVRAALARGHDVTHWEHGAFWRDVNTPDALDEVGRLLAEAGP
jgi:mannose-1-phosphate guanylyltransferase